MLIVVLVTSCLCIAAVAATASVVRLAADRLGLDVMTVLLWFGLAEWQSDRAGSRSKRVQRPTLSRLARSARRPRTPRSRSRSGSTRRPAHP